MFFLLVEGFLGKIQMFPWIPIKITNRDIDEDVISSFLRTEGGGGETGGEEGIVPVAVHVSTNNNIHIFKNPVSPNRRCFP